MLLGNIFRKASPAIRRAYEAGGTAPAGAFGIERLLGKMRLSKEITIMTSISPKARDVGERLFRGDFPLAKNFLGEKRADSAENTFRDLRDTMVGKGREIDQSSYKEYRLRLSKLTDPDPTTTTIIQEHKYQAGKLGLDTKSIFKGRNYLTEAEFYDEAAFAQRRNTANQSFIHPIPEVNRIAKYYKEEGFEPIRKMGIETGELKKEIENNPDFVSSYLSQIYKTDFIREHRQDFVNLVARNLGIPHAGDLAKSRESVTKLQSRVDSIRAKGKNPSRKIIATLEEEKANLKEFEDFDLDAAANEITDNILASPYGMQSHDLAFVGQAKYEKTRKLRIQSSLLAEFEPFLENNIERIFAMYTRTMLPRIILRKTFGKGTELNLSQVLDNVIGEIGKDYNKLMADPTVTKAEVRSLELEKRRIERYTRASFDEFIGLTRLPSDPAALTSRISRAALQINLLRALGGVTVSSIPDIARFAARFGLSKSLEGLGKIIAHSDLAKLSLKEVKDIAGIYELQLGQRVMEQSELYQLLVPYESAVERVLDKATNWFGHITLINYWNQYMKQFAGFLGMQWILEAAQKASRGEILPEKLTARLLEGGIGNEELKGIWEQFSKHGFEEHGIFVAQSAQWTDRALANKLATALKREVDLTILTPALGSRPFLGMFEPVSRHLLQFRSFSLTAVNAIFLSGLQYRDAQILNQVVLGVTLGTFVYYLKGLQAQHRTGEAPDLNWNEVLAQGIDRSGILGFVGDMSAVMERVSRGKIGINPLLGATRASRFKTLDAINLVGGPTVGLIRDLGNITSSGISQEYSNNDVSSFRRTIPFNNLAYLGWLFDNFEEGMKKTLVQPTSQAGQSFLPQGRR